MMTVFLRICRVSSENRPHTVISANLALFSPYFARANPDSSEEDPDDPLVSQNKKAMTVYTFFNAASIDAIHPEKIAASSIVTIGAAAIFSG
eukprot:scaffold12556_cov44-Cyclotella_meneghiniana.AAC.4